MDLARLLESVELAADGARDLDLGIAEALGLELRDPQFTRSVDAAISLIPPGWSIHRLSQQHDCNGHFTGWSAELYRADDGIVRYPASRLSPTPALALCAAALRLGERHGLSGQVLGSVLAWRPGAAEPEARALQ